MNRQAASRNLRRTGQSLCLLCFFLAGLLYRPSAPTLICRMTGRLMQLVYEAAAARAAVARPADSLPCCRVHRVGEDYALTSPGCCDLRQGSDRAPKAPCLLPLSLADAALGGLPPVSLTVPLPLVETVPESGRMPRLFFSIRPPPRGVIALRAPPA